MNEQYLFLCPTGHFAQFGRNYSLLAAKVQRILQLLIFSLELRSFFPWRGVTNSLQIHLNENSLMSRLWSFWRKKGTVQPWFMTPWDLLRVENWYILCQMIHRMSLLAAQNELWKQSWAGGEQPFKGTNTLMYWLGKGWQGSEDTRGWLCRRQVQKAPQGRDSRSLPCTKFLPCLYLEGQNIPFFSFLST